MHPDSTNVKKNYYYFYYFARKASDLLTEKEFLMIPEVQSSLLQE